MDLLERMSQIVELIGGGSFAYMDEYDLQTGVHAALEEAGWPAIREVQLSDTLSRVDIWVDGPWLRPAGIVIEVKIAGSQASVNRQLARYALCPEVAGIILVTTRSKHHHVPLEMNGKPVRLATLIGAGL